jgi:hypothetical protein
MQRLDGQAAQAVGANREDLARPALERKQDLQQYLTGYDEQIKQFKAQQQKLVETGWPARICEPVERLSRAQLLVGNRACEQTNVQTYRGNVERVPIHQKGSATWNKPRTQCNSRSSIQTDLSTG